MPVGQQPKHLRIVARSSFRSGVIARFSAEAVRAILANLPPPQAEALALHAILGYTLEEIAVASGVSVDTVHSRLKLAKLALRKQVLNDPRWREFAGVTP